jgi:phosphatidylglycerol:prolipoprotein diacylglycerol transferase
MLVRRISSFGLDSLRFPPTLFSNRWHTRWASLYRRDRRRFGDPIDQSERNSVLVAAIVGAALGSKLLAGFEDPVALLHAPWSVLLCGKTMVGGLLGGTPAVEWVTRRMGITRRTGDLFADHAIY